MFSTRFLIPHQASWKKRQNYKAIVVNYGPDTIDGEILASGTPRLFSRKAKEKCVTVINVTGKHLTPNMPVTSVLLDMTAREPT